MTRQKFTAAFVFSILLVLFVATMASAQSAPPPAPQGVPCLRSVERQTTFKQYSEFVEDRALLATTTFSLPVGSESCVATYQVIYSALTGAITLNPTLECSVKDQWTQMFAYCTGVISGTARADFFVSQKFHGSELMQSATDTDMTWQFDASQMRDATMADSQDDEPFVWAAIPCDTWDSMELDGPPWCNNVSNSRVGNWKNAPNCTMVAQRYWYYVDVPNQPSLSYLSTVRWNAPGQNPVECYYAYQINSAILNAYQRFGDSECGALDGKTVFCVGYTKGSGGVDIHTYGMLSNGIAPFSVTDYVFSVSHTWLFFGRAIFLPATAKS